MISILANGDAKFAIHHNDDRIGWLHGRWIGFRGFTTQSDVRDAVTAVYEAIESVVRSARGGPANAPFAAHRLKLVHDGGLEWFVHQGASVARLLRPQRRAFDTSLGLELALPDAVGSSQRFQAAHAAAIAVLPYRDRVSLGAIAELPEIVQPRRAEQP